MVDSNGYPYVRAYAPGWLETGWVSGVFLAAIYYTSGVPNDVTVTMDSLFVGGTQIQDNNPGYASQCKAMWALV